MVEIDKVFLFIEKFKLSLFDRGIFRSFLMSFLVEKNLNVIFWFNKLVFLVNEEFGELIFMKY